MTVEPGATVPLRMLVLGGVRSGKSAYAEAVAESYRTASRFTGVRYVATGRRDPADADWQQRIDAHRSRRPPEWTTLESTKNLSTTLLDDSESVTLVDDIGTWLTGVMDDSSAWDLPRGTVQPHCDALVDAVARCRGRLVLVSPEVGWGVIPHTRAGRVFQDEMGALNNRLAQACDNVVLVVAGLPLTMKGTYLPDGSLVMKGRQ